MVTQCLRSITVWIFQKLEETILRYFRYDEKIQLHPGVFHIIVFINFYAMALTVFLKSFFADIADLAFIDQVTFSRNFENNWYKKLNFRQLVKIILINEYSCLQMYPNERSFLTYWFLRIKWLFNKYVKITKERAIHKHRFSQSHKNRFSQSFKKSPVYSLVTETI